MNFPMIPNPRHQQRGVALVLVLAFVVLLTVVVLAFFSRSMDERQLSNSSVSSNNADAFARSATDIIIGDLKQEIADPGLHRCAGGQRQFANHPLHPEVRGQHASGPQWQPGRCGRSGSDSQSGATQRPVRYDCRARSQ